MRTTIIAILTFGAIIAARGQGTFEAMNVSSSSGGQFTGVAGWTFETTYAVTLTDLGCAQTVIEDNGNTPIRVGLWANDGTLLVYRDVTSTSPVLLNQTRYEPVDALSLLPNQIYHLGAFQSSGSVWLNLAGPSYGDFTVAGAIDPASIHRTVNESGFAAPSLVTGSSVIPVGPNFIYYVPEPSSFALAALAGVVWLWRTRRG